MSVRCVGGCPVLASASLRRRRARSTSAGRARRCTTGPWPARRRHVRAPDRGHRRGPEPPRVDAGDHRRAGMDRHLGRRWPLRGPALPERPCGRPRRRRAPVVRRGRRVLLRPDRRRDPGAREGARALRATTVLARPGPRTGAGPRAAIPRARRLDAVVDQVAATCSSTTRRSRTSSCCGVTARRCSCSPMSSTTWRWVSRTSCAPKSTFRTRPSSRCCGRRSATSRRCGGTYRCW